MAKILVADDNENIRTLVDHIVTEAGYECICAEDGIAAISAVIADKPDLLVLDIMMPGMDGFSVCTELRKRGETLPIMFLSAKGDIVDKGVAFKLGGDDYLVKPFEPQELVFRIEALLRRAGMGSATPAPPAEAGKNVQVFGELSIDTRRHRVTLAGKEVDLTPQEFLLLSILAEDPGRVFTREQLTRELWGDEYVGTPTSLTVIVRRIRTKIEEDPSNPRYLQTIWRVGYRFGD